jgi:hypothetical protein
MLHPTVRRLFPWQSAPLPGPESRPCVLRAGVRQPASAGRGQPWLIARSLCRFRHFDLASVPVRDRRAVLRNLLLAWSPFDSCDFQVVLQADSALAYAWDAAVVGALAPDSVQKWPESMLRPAAVADGLRLLECLEGFELQCWQSGRLIASRWWAELPSSAQLSEALRSFEGGAAVAARAAPPPTQAEQAAWLHRPWAEILSLEGLASTTSRAERLAAGVALVCLAGLSGGQAQGLYSAYQARSAAEAELASAKLAAAPVLSARDRALAQARELDALVKQLSAAQPLEVLAHLQRLLPLKGAVLKDFDLSGDKLRLGLELSPDVQRSALVKELQAGGWFADVVEQREVAGRNWVSFEMRLKSVVPPLLPERAAEGKKP